MSSWCDKLASIPTVGFTLDWHFATRDSLLEALAPLLTKYVDEGKPKFTIPSTDATSASINTDTGFNYAVDSTKISVTFQHMVRTQEASAGLPILKMLSKPLPYTELLPLLSAELLQATLLLPGVRARKITRVGVVSTTVVAEDELPPGIARFIRHVGQPWNNDVAGYAIQVIANIAKTNTGFDRCLHSFSKLEDDPETLVRIYLDWQRTFTANRAISNDALVTLLREAQTAALQYFEDIGQGERFDENVDSATA